jgi:hypothetical protein
MINSLRSGHAILISAGNATTSLWMPLSAIAIYVFSLVVAVAMLLMWRKSYVLLGIFWSFFVIFMVSINVRAGRTVSTPLLLYSAFLLVVMVGTTILLRRQVASHEP